MVSHCTCDLRNAPEGNDRGTRRRRQVRRMRPLVRERDTCACPKMRGAFALRHALRFAGQDVPRAKESPSRARPLLTEARTMTVLPHVNERSLLGSVRYFVMHFRAETRCT